MDFVGSFLVFGTYKLVILCKTKGDLGASKNNLLKFPLGTAILWGNRPQYFDFHANRLSLPPVI